jgi:hypothetical protein
MNPSGKGSMRRGKGLALGTRRMINAKIIRCTLTIFGAA